MAGRESPENSHLDSVSQYASVHIGALRRQTTLLVLVHNHD